MYAISLVSVPLHPWVPPPALLKLLDVALPCFVETVRTEQERQVVMGVLETMNSVIKSCKEEAFKNPSHLQEVSHVIRDVLKKKVRRRKSNGVWEVVSFVKLWLQIQYHIVGNVEVVHVKPHHIFFSFLCRLFVRMVVMMTVMMMTNR